MDTVERLVPALDMSFKKFHSLPSVILPAGYNLWTLRNSSEEDWIEALNATGQLGKWDRNQAKQWLESERHAIKEGTFIIYADGTPVATACAIPPTSTEKRPEFGWVSASPAHQGKGLGYQVSLAVLHFIKECGFPETFLHTDDWRLPAIKTYLKLGFEPDITHETHPERWKTIIKKIDSKLPHAIN